MIQRVPTSLHSISSFLLDPIEITCYFHFQYYHIYRRFTIVKKSQKTIFSCQSCGYQATKWMGKCPDCGTWDSFVEERPIVGSQRRGIRPLSGLPTGPVPIHSIDLDTELRNTGQSVRIARRIEDPTEGEVGEVEQGTATRMGHAALEVTEIDGEVDIKNDLSSQQHQQAGDHRLGDL